MTSSDIILVFALVAFLFLAKAAKEGYPSQQKPKKKTKIYKYKKVPKPSASEQAMWAKALASIPDVAPAAPTVQPSQGTPATAAAAAIPAAAPATVDTTDYSYVDPFGVWQDRTYYEGRV